MDEQNRDLPEKEIVRHPESGVRGGSAAFAAPAPGTELFAWAKTVVRWSPIWVGLLVAIGINLVIQVLGLAVTLSSAAPVGYYVSDILRSAAIWSAIASLVALFVGGFLAGRLGVQTGLRSGVLQGTVVWALYVLVAVILSGFGLGGFAGMGDIRTAATTTGVTAAQAHRIMSTAATGLWWALGGLVVSWLAAIIGGVLGFRSAEPLPDDQV